jgi:hypothetical protein
MLNKKIGLIALLASFAAGEIMAGTIANYTVGDVLVCFRKGGNDMVVDAGPISTLTNGTPNQRISITQYAGTQLAQVGTNGVSWSAFTWFDNSVSPNWTLFVTSPRTSLNVQTTPWQEKGLSSQKNTAQRMATIPPGALDELNLDVYPVSTTTAVVEEDSSDGNKNYTDGVSYHDALAGSYGGDFNGNFDGNPENTTTNNFTTAGQVVRSDFYQLTPTGGFGFGKLLGYFEFAPDGTMTYVAYPSAVPVITSITRSGTMTTITYTTGLYGTYTLRGINSLTSGTPQSGWSAITTLVSGDTQTHSTSFTDTDGVKFYTITAQ